MRLIIHSQGAVEAVLRRYNGRGIFSSIGRKLFSFGLKKVINTAEKENHPHIIADVIVNGPSPPIDKNNKKEKVVKLQKKVVKRKLTPTTPSSKPIKVRKYSKNTVNQLINSGSGIVLD